MFKPFQRQRDDAHPCGMYNVKTYFKSFIYDFFFYSQSL